MPHLYSYGALPYGKVKNLEVQSRVRNGLRLEKPPMCHDSFYEMMLLCWGKNWKERPTFALLRKQILVYAALGPVGQRGRRWSRMTWPGPSSLMLLSAPCPSFL